MKKKKKKNYSIFTLFASIKEEEEGELLLLLLLLLLLFISLLLFEEEIEGIFERGRERLKLEIIAPCANEPLFPLPSERGSNLGPGGATTDWPLMTSLAIFPVPIEPVFRRYVPFSESLLFSAFSARCMASFTVFSKNIFSSLPFWGVISCADIHGLFAESFKHICCTFKVGCDDVIIPLHFAGAVC